MTKRIACLLALGVFLAVAGTTRADDQKDIQGTWKIEKALRGGEEMPTEESAKVTLEFKDDKVIVHDPKRDEPATFKLDGTTKPKNITIKPEKKDQEVFGIYELNGDTLKVCFTKEGGARPKEFESKAGSEMMLFVLKREKK